MDKVIIIGGGVAGLSAGVYAQRAGLTSVVYEQHTVPGGECTGWDRKGYHIDGCIHWLTGTKEGTGVNQVWKDVGALGNVQILQPESFTTAEFDGETAILHRDLEKLKAHLLELSPVDKDAIEELCHYIEIFFAAELPAEKPFDLMNPLELIKLMSSMGKIGAANSKLNKFTITEYIQRFQSPAIREALKAVAPGHYSAYALPASLGTAISGNGGWPAGGSRAMAQRMAEKYISLGGELNLGTAVESIIVENGVALGVILADGSKEYADYTVPACDAHVTLNKLLGGKYPDRKFDSRYSDESANPLISCVYASFAVDADLSDYPASHVFPVTEFNFEDSKQDMLSVKHYCFEPSFAPAGKSVLIVYIQADYSWWQEKRQDHPQYKQEKSRLANDILQRIQGRYPELKGKVSVLDVATPVTYERYCSAYKGSWMSFAVTPKSKQQLHNGKVKGVKNLYMAGQWLMPPGGLPVAAVTGKWAIQRICKSEGLNIKI